MKLQLRLCRMIDIIIVKIFLQYCGGEKKNQYYPEHGNGYLDLCGCSSRLMFLSC